MKKQIKVLETRAIEMPHNFSDSSAWLIAYKLEGFEEWFYLKDGRFETVPEWQQIDNENQNT